MYFPIKEFNWSYLRQGIVCIPNEHYTHVMVIHFSKHTTNQWKVFFKFFLKIHTSILKFKHAHSVTIFAKSL